VVSVIIKFNRTVFRSTGSQRFVSLQVQEVNGFAVVTVNGLTELTSRRIWVVIIEHALNGVPTTSEQDILLDRLLGVFLFNPSPVDESRHKLLLFVFVLDVLLERLHSSSILDVEAVHSAALISNEKLAASAVHAHASDIFRCGVTEYTLKSTVNSVPDFNAPRMSSDEGVEHRVVKYTAASLIISQMVVSRLVIVVKFHASTSSNDSLGRLSDCETVDFVKRAVESLYRSESTHIPDAEHTRNISRDNLVGSLHPLNSHQTVVMSLESEDLLGDVRVPDKHIMVRTSRQNKVVIFIPVQRENTLRMTLERCFGLHTVHSPQTDLAIQTSRSK
jgi:hypothetical protein